MTFTPIGSPIGHALCATEPTGIRCECGRLYSSRNALTQHHDGKRRDQENAK